MYPFKLKTTLMVAAFFPLLTSLGIWQITRYQEKRTLENIYESRKLMKSLPISHVTEYSDPMFLPVHAIGRYVKNQYYLHDNQVFRGVVGYELIMPFVTENGLWLWINRGWIPTGDRKHFPTVHTPTELITIEGVVYKQPGKPFLLSQDLWSESSEKTWPKRIQSINLTRMTDTLNNERGDLNDQLLSFTVILNQHKPGSEQYRPVTLNMRSDKHLAYAFQWFVMALVLVVLYGYLIRHEVKEQRYD